MRAIVSSEAVKPPTLTSPLARPIACTGVKVRARSKPTIEAGPPVAVVQAITTTIHAGAGPGPQQHRRPGDDHHATMPMTIHERQ